MATQQERLAKLKAMQSPFSDVLGRVQVLKGEDGKTPKKGVDYLTPAEMNMFWAEIDKRINSFKKGLKGDRGDKGESIIGDKGPKGDKGDPGKDGKTPVHGIDYFTKKDQTILINRIIPQIRVPTVAQIVAEVKRLPIEYKDLKGAPDLKDLPSLVSFLKTGGFRGGGDTVGAGAGISISNVNGTKIISSTATGTVTSVISSDNSVTITNPTTVPDLSVSIGALTHAATSKTTPVDADEVPIADSAAAFILKKLTWANLKATLKTYFDTLYEGVITSGGLNTVWHGNKTFSAVVEADISLSNNTTNNATVAKHGFLPILSGNANQFLDGNGNYSTPAAGAPNSYLSTTFTNQTSVNIVHNFGAYPIVQILDTSKNVMIPETIVHNTLNDFTFTFSGSTSGTVIASIGSPQPQALIVASGNYTVLTTDYFVKVTGSGAIITLPTAVGNTGRTFQIINASPGDITLNTTSSQTINGQLTQTLHVNESLSVVSDGANYWYY